MSQFIRCFILSTIWFLAQSTSAQDADSEDKSFIDKVTSLPVWAQALIILALVMVNVSVVAVCCWFACRTPDHQSLSTMEASGNRELSKSTERDSYTAAPPELDTKIGKKAGSKTEGVIVGSKAGPSSKIATNINSKTMAASGAKAAKQMAGGQAKK